MNLSAAQREAMLRLGSSTTGHDFIAPEVLEELLALKLVRWRSRDDLDLTQMGGEVYKKLAGKPAGGSSS